MTNPDNTAMTPAGRVYTWPATGEEFSSVTTLLGAGVPKPFLVGWAARTAAEYAADNLDALTALSTKADRIQLIRSAPNAHRDAAGALGDEVHAACQRIAEGGPLRAGDPPHVAHYRRLLREHDITILDCERTVYNRTHHYAGTYDAIGRVGDTNSIIDIKSSKGVYPEVALQLCAYSHAEFADGGGVEIRAPRPDGGYVIHLRPDGAALHRCDIGDTAWAYLCAVMEVAAWTRRIGARHVTGKLPSSRRCASGNPLRLIGRLLAQLDDGEHRHKAILAHYGVRDLDELYERQASEVLQRLRGHARAAGLPETPDKSNNPTASIQESAA